jgi:CRP-like cAMP-binding protein
MSEDGNLSTRPPFSTNNFILNSLPVEDLMCVLPDLELVELPLGTFLYHHDDPIKYIYFPETAMVSVIAVTPGGENAETGVVGAEGIVGIDALLGADSAFNETVIQQPGDGYKIKTAAVRREFIRGGAFQKNCLQFVRLFMIQISQTALCNRLHTVEERLARWLLLSHDRAAVRTRRQNPGNRADGLRPRRRSYSHTALRFSAARPETG